MNWDAREDIATALYRGFGIRTDGIFFVYPYHVADRMSNNGIDPHAAVTFALTKQAAAGDEFAARALAEALRRRMTR